MEDRSADRHSRAEQFMKLTSGAKSFLGPADCGDPAAPIVHRHDALENAADEEVSGYDIEQDSHRQHYAVSRKQQRQPGAP